MWFLLGDTVYSDIHNAYGVVLGTPVDGFVKVDFCDPVNRILTVSTFSVRNLDAIEREQVA